jgi:DNA modification methylase
MQEIKTYIKDGKTWASIDDLRNWEQNPRTITEKNYERLKRQVIDHGVYKPLLITPDGEVIGGNMRLRAYRELGFKECWVSVVNPKDEAEKLKYALSDNDRVGQYDEDSLANLLGNFEDVDLSNFSVDLREPTNLQDLLDQFKEVVEDVVEDEAPAVEEGDAASKLGEVYQLGSHRLMCGDSTKIEDVERLMDGAKADMVFTDPPYGMKKESEGVLNDNLNYDDLLEFNKKWIPLTFEALKDNGSWYCWGIDEPLMDIYSEILKPMAKQNKITFRNLITWDKGNGQGQLSSEFRMYPIADEKCLFIQMGIQGLILNADNYWEKYEPIRKYLYDSRIAMGWDVPTMKKIVGHSDLLRDHWTSKSQFNMPTKEVYDKLKKEAEKQRQERKINNNAFRREYDDLRREYDDLRAYFDNTHDNMNDVWHFERTSQKERELTGEHATPKPIALCARAIKSSSRENEIVLDVFGGSGSTLIACEQLNRTCYMMELDPKYVDVIRRRYAKFIGKEEEWQTITPKIS